MNLLFKIALVGAVLMILASVTPVRAHAVQVGPLYPSQPVFTDLDGVSLESVGAGSQIIITTEFGNITEERMNFLALIEVRNSEGVTVFLAWQSGIIAPNSLYTIGISWLAEEPSGYYYARHLQSPVLNSQKYYR